MKRTQIGPGAAALARGSTLRTNVRSRTIQGSTELAGRCVNSPGRGTEGEASMQDDSIPHGYCQCGCGARTNLAPQTRRRDGWVKGEPVAFLRGHRRSRAGDGPNPSGLCKCGCGQQTKIAGSTRGRWVKGTPVEYVNGHAARQSGEDYVERDCGYITPCWVWKLHTQSFGHGRLGRDGEIMAHRWYYAQRFGPIPEGLQLDHLCRNPPCVNPDHLEPVTGAVNTQRGALAKLTPSDVREIRRSCEPTRALAERFGVHVRTIQDVTSGKSWRNIDAA